MKVLIIGGDGYCGWATALHFAKTGDQVINADNFARRTWDAQLGVGSLTPIAPMYERLAQWKALGERAIEFVDLDVTEFEPLCALLSQSDPDAVVHFGHQRSAPYSMIDRNHAARTLINNTLGNLNLLWALREYAPEAHLVKLGTMGEYGTPNIDIEEGFIDITHNGRTDRLPFPKQPGSFYHLTKVHDSDQIYFVCRAWGMRATDLHQGIVYGVHTDQTSRSPGLVNRFDYDHVYGTALNRFCVQAALGHPLTVYGSGGQTRSFLNIRDTVRCVELAARLPAAAGEYRVFNQYSEIFSIGELAREVVRVAEQFGLGARIEHQENPRAEKEQHYYHTVNANLRSVGFEPTLLDDEVLRELIGLALDNRDKIDPAVIRPAISWKPHPKTASLSA